MEPKTPLPWYPYEYCDGWTAIVDHPPMPRPICVFMDQGTDTFQAVGRNAESNLRYAIHAANLHKRLVEFVKELPQRSCAEKCDCQVWYRGEQQRCACGAFNWNARRAAILKEAGA